MPIPKPNKNENHDVFLQRCMRDETMNTDYPDQIERSSVCHTAWEKRNPKDKKTEINTTIIHKQFDLSELKDGEFVVLASDGSQDRDGDTISPKGWNLTNFMNNGAFLYGHNKDQFPVAKPISYEINGNGQLLIKGKFADKGSSDFTDAVRSLAEQGILKGVSVGFIGQSEAKQNGHGRNYIQQELIECSFTPVPANQNCKLLTKDFSPEIQNKLFEKSEEEELLEKALELREVIKAATVIEKSSIHVNRKAVAHAKSLVKEGKVNTGAWSISAEEENALLGKDEDWEAYSKWFLAFDTSADSKTKAYYKYPIGKDGEVYRKGIIAAKSRAAQQGEDAVSSAADSILQLIDKDKKENAIREILAKYISKEEIEKHLLTILINVDDEDESLETEPDSVEPDNSSDQATEELLNQISSLIDSFANGQPVGLAMNDDESESEAEKQEAAEVAKLDNNSDAEEEVILNRIKDFQIV